MRLRDHYSRRVDHALRAHRQPNTYLRSRKTRFSLTYLFRVVAHPRVPLTLALQSPLHRQGQHNAQRDRDDRRQPMTASPDFEAKSAWTMTLLLTGLALINFLDKIVLGLVAVPLTAELHLSPEQFGLVAGSFFWLFSIS